MYFIFYAEQPFQANNTTAIHTNPLIRKNKKPAIPARLSHFFRLSAFSSSACCFRFDFAVCCSSIIALKTPIPSIRGRGSCFYLKVLNLRLHHLLRPEHHHKNHRRRHQQHPLPLLLLHQLNRNHLRNHPHRHHQQTEISALL